MIRVLALDIDGVLTNGTVTIDDTGRELKTVSYRDIDAVFHAHRSGLTVALVTGEDSPWVDQIVKRLDVKHVWRGAKNKGRALHELCASLQVAIADVCYVGDAPRDADALVMAGLGLAPADASPDAIRAADHVLQHRGGLGAVAEAVQIVLEARSRA